jgi:hypothetical protein
MIMSNLRSKLIRLAHANPELRADLLPLLKKIAGEEDPRVQGLSSADRKVYDRWLSEGEPELADRWLNRVSPIEDSSSVLWDKIDAIVKSARERSMKEGKTVWKDNTPQHLPLFRKYLEEGLKKVFPGVSIKRQIDHVVHDPQDRFKTRMDITDYLHRYLQGNPAKFASDKEAGLPRSTYLPKDNDTLTERINTPEGLDIWTWEMPIRGNPAYSAIAFAGKADKPLWQFNYSDFSRRERQIQDTIKNYEAGAEAKRKRQEERKQFQHGLQVGDILVASWGYDQTNVNWYAVVGVPTVKMVLVREIGSKIISSDGSGSDRVVPDPSRPIGSVLRRIPGGTAGNPRVKIEDSIVAHKWEGRPERATSSGWGH